MSLAGTLRFALAWDGRRVLGVQIAAARPLLAGRLLAGRHADEAKALVPLLFGICRQAQGVAAAAALGAAQGAPPVGGALRAAAMAAVAETARECLWRLLLDLPAALGEAAQDASFAALGRRLAAPAAGQDWPTLAGELDEFLARAVFGMAPSRWPGGDGLSAAQRWMASGVTATARQVGELWDMRWGGSDVALMPAAGAALAEEVARAALADAGYCHRPHWRGAVLETGALARRAAEPLLAQALAAQGSSLGARALARLAELARLAGSLAQGEVPAGWAGALTLGPGMGAGWCETARGLLVHAARLEDGRVASYAIVAPTEWNFHPQGPLVRGLAGFETGDEAALRARALLLTQSLDPCVACEVEVRRA